MVETVSALYLNGVLPTDIYPGAVEVRVWPKISWDWARVQLL